ncbi:TonB-dependent receptor [bacterium]|nr:TonB-dependent receptor [bacterium]RQV97072.1 MAG: TonB-dependent receptor [bacterium]
MKKIDFRGVILLNLIVCLNALASNQYEVKSDSIHVKYYFDPIVVTATKVTGAQRDIAASISVVEEIRIRQGSNDAVFGVLENAVPGLHLTEWGVMGFGAAGTAAGKISVRGLGGTADTHVMILRNGRPDYMGLMGCTIGDEFSIDGVERIEVVRGPASFLYGTNATGGVVNIISKRMHTEGFQTDLKAEYGAFNTQKLVLDHGGKIGHFDYFLTGSIRKTDGHREDSKNSYENNTITAHFGYQLAQNTTIEFNCNFADIYLYDPGMITDPKTDDWYDIIRWGGDVTLNHLNRFGDAYVKFHGNFGRHDFADGWHSNDRMIGLMVYQNGHLFNGNTTTIGFDAKRYGGNGENLTLNWMNEPSIPYQERTITEYAPYIHTQQLFFKRFILSAGLRVEHHTLFGSVNIPKVGLVSHLTESTSFRVTISKGFRSPSIRELYFFPSHNEALRPDEYWNYEIGMSQHIGRRLNLEMAVFQIEGDNLITLVKGTSGYQLMNSYEIKNRGYELMFNWSPVNRLEMNASWAYVDMENVIPNAPEKKLTTYAAYQFSKFRITGELVVVRDWIGRDGATPVPHIYPMKDYAVVNLSIQAYLLNPLSIQLILRNAFNADYEAMYGYPMPGRLLLFDVGLDL